MNVKHYVPDGVQDYMPVESTTESSGENPPSPTVAGQ